MLNIGILRARTSLPLCGVLIGAFLSSAPASAQPRGNGRNDVIIYADPNFHGASQTLRGDTPDLRPQGLNDKVSSIEIPAGQAWEVCQDINYGTYCQILRASVTDLRTIGWNDRISSLRRVNGNGNFRNGNDGDFRDGRSGGVYPQFPTSQALVFFDRTGYRGTAYDERSLGNRTARSVEVRTGRWQLCDHTGRCATIDQNVTDLSRVGLNGQITSVRAVNSSQGYDQGRDPRDRQYEDQRGGSNGR